MKSLLFILLVLFSCPANASRVAFDPLGKCEIEGTINNVNLTEAYVDPCVTEDDCPVGAFVPSTPAMYFLSVNIKSIACVPEGLGDPLSYRSQFRLNDENTIVVYQADVNAGDRFDVGDTISGRVEFEALQNRFTRYILINNKK